MRVSEFLGEQDSTDTNSYTLGRVGRHYVIIAGLPGGQYGTTSGRSGDDEHDANICARLVGDTASWTVFTW